MSFVVDGSQWRFDRLGHEVVVARIEAFLERVQIALEREERIWIGDDFQTRPMTGGLDLWGLKGPDSPIRLADEVWQELTAFLSRASFYLDGNWPDGFDGSGVEFDGAPEGEICVDVAWAHHNVRSGKAVGCLSISRDGSFVTRSTSGTVSVHWIASEISHVSFWREAIRIEGDGEASLVGFASHAYPNIYFVDGVLRSLGDLDGGYLARRAEVQNSLAVLSDSGCWAFTFPPPALTPAEAAGSDLNARPTNQLIERRFQGLGLDVAPEKPNVRLNAKYRRAREMVVGGRTLYCEWHVKLEPHRNRIHFHAPTNESGNRLIVAIICKHLPLPSD